MKGCINYDILSNYKYAKLFAYAPIDACAARPASSRFQIIQPVGVGKNTGSSRQTSQWSTISFRHCSRLPPALWMIALGLPVVPEEYSTQSGWSKAKRSYAISPGAKGAMRRMGRSG